MQRSLADRLSAACVPVVLRGLAGALAPVLALAFLLPAAAAAEDPPPDILIEPPYLTFEELAVVAGNVTPKGQVAWFSVAREALEFEAAVVRREAVLTDEDEDGIVRFEMEKGVPLRSIWVVVDLTSGEFALGTPADYPIEKGQGVGDVLDVGSKGATGKLDLLVGRREMLEVFVARAETGAWAATAFDGGEMDQDGEATNSVAMEPAGMEPVADSPPAPEELLPGDVVVTIDPNTMDVAAFRVPEPAPEGDPQQ